MLYLVRILEGAERLDRPDTSVIGETQGQSIGVSAHETLIGYKLETYMTLYTEKRVCTVAYSVRYMSIHSFIHWRIHKVPFQEIYSEAPLAQPRRYR